MVLRSVIIHRFANGMMLMVDQIAGPESTGFAGSNWSDPYLVDADGNRVS